MRSAEEVATRPGHPRRRRRARLARTSSGRLVNAPTARAELDGHPVLESIDAIRTLLLRDADARTPTRVLMVTSAVSGEGKTTLASHHRPAALARGPGLGKTLLIDGDLRQPAVHQLFEVPMQPGFSEVLLGEVEATVDAIQKTNACERPVGACRPASGTARSLQAAGPRRGWPASSRSCGRNSTSSLSIRTRCCRQPIRC